MEAYGIRLLIPLFDQREEWNRRICMIHEAKQFLYASTYFLHCDRYGREYVEALLAARARGVAVTLLIDGFAHQLARNIMSTEDIAFLEESVVTLQNKGANVIFYRSRSFLQRWLGSGMHIKIQLSDNGDALFASGNISSTSYERWKEFSVYVRGAIVPRLLQELADLGVVVEANHMRHLVSMEKNAATGKIGYLSHNPVMDPHPLNPVMLTHPNRITDYLVKEFANTAHSICLTSFYFKPPPVLIKSLIDVAKRGVKIEIFHSHRDSLGASILPWIPSIYHYRALLDAGVTIYESLSGEHSKIILIDGKKAIFGSYNLEYAAHDRLAEGMMVSDDKALLHAITANFSGLRSGPDVTKVDKVTLLQLPATVLWKTLLLRPFVRWI